MAGLAMVVATVGPPNKSKVSGEEAPVLLRPAVARTVSRPFLALLIDLYWLRTINAITEADTPAKARALYDYGRVITDLDPRFLQAYTYVGLNVPFQTALRQYANVEQAVDLYRRGIAVYPEEFRLHMYLGFTLMEMSKQYRQAAEAFAALSRLPRAPPFAAALSVRLLAHDGDARRGLELMQVLLEQVHDEQSRAMLESMASDLAIEVQLQDVERSLAAFRTTNGRSARSLEELRQAGVYSGPDVDAAGNPITIDENGKATSASLGRRVMIFE